MIINFSGYFVTVIRTILSHIDKYKTEKKGNIPELWNRDDYLSYLLLCPNEANLHQPFASRCRVP